jgi:hypothetical protein
MEDAAPAREEGKSMAESRYTSAQAEQFLFAEGWDKYHDRFLTRAYVQEGLDAYKVRKTSEIMKLILAAVASLLIANRAGAEDPLLAKHAKMAGISLATARKLDAAGFVFDPSDNSFTTPEGRIKQCISVLACRLGELGYYP